MNNIKFNKYNVTDGTNKARVWYSRNVQAKGTQKIITIYDKDYSRNLSKIFGSSVRNDTDIMTDYFEKDRLTFVDGSSEYAQLDNRLKELGL